MSDKTMGTEHLEPWLDDGNIILAIGDKHFRVHRSILSLYSEVFKDMFAIPQPSDGTRKDDTLDGCPVIHLQDAVIDVQLMLKALYDRSYVFFHNEPMPIAALGSFSRMGKKYGIKQLTKEVLPRLAFKMYRMDYASRVSTSEKVALFPCVSGGDPYNFTIMNIASEIGLTSAVAIAVLHCCIACPALSITGGYDFEGSRCTLSIINQQYCLLGLRHIVDARRQLTLSMLNSITYQHAGCQTALLTSLRNFQACAGPFIAWQNTWDTGLCTSCRAELRRRYEETRTKLLDDFPIQLGLGRWEELDKDVMTS